MHIDNQETDQVPEQLRSRGFGDVPFPMSRKTQALREEDSYMEAYGKEWGLLCELTKALSRALKAWFQPASRWVSASRNKAQPMGSQSNNREQ